MTLYPIKYWLVGKDADGPIVSNGRPGGDAGRWTCNERAAQPHLTSLSWNQHNGSATVSVGCSQRLHDWDPPRISPFISTVLTCRNCFLANLSGLGSKMVEGLDALCRSGRPTCGGGSRENTGAATFSLPPFFDQGFRSLTRRVRDGSGNEHQ